MFEKIAAHLAEQPAISVDEIRPETTLEDLGIDSLDTVELIMDLEEMLGVDLEIGEQISNVGELAAYVESKIG